jgi:hypothetical protein
MPKLIIEIHENLKPDGEDRIISGFAFQVRIEPLNTDTDETETVLPHLVPLFFAAVQDAMRCHFGDPVMRHVALIPPTGIDPLPTLETMISDYQASKDNEFPAEMEA